MSADFMPILDNSGFSGENKLIVLDSDKHPAIKIEKS